MAIVLLSGGMDSAVCLHWAIARWGVPGVTALAVEYGQRHWVEMHAAARIARRAEVEHVQTFLGAKGVGFASALTDVGTSVQGSGPSGLPSTFVPGRNLLMLTLAAAAAQARGSHDVVIGCNDVDAAGYPDCRAEFLAKAAEALSLALDWPIEIYAPLLLLDKRATVELGVTLGCLASVGLSWSCYDPQPAGPNKGHVAPCGVCSACVLRAGGFAAAGVADPARSERRV